MKVRLPSHHNCQNTMIIITLVIIEVIEIMESCDLHYQPMSATSLSSDNPDAAFSFLRGGNSFKQRQQGNNNNKSPFQNEDTVLVMEPNLDLLVTYHEYINTSSSSTASSSFQKNTMSSGSKKNKKLLNQHAIVSPELRHLIYVEQRKYSIRRKVSVSIIFRYFT